MILNYIIKFLGFLVEVAFGMALAILVVYVLDWIGRRW